MADHPCWKAGRRLKAALISYQLGRAGVDRTLKEVPEDSGEGWADLAERLLMQMMLDLSKSPNLSSFEPSSGGSEPFNSATKFQSAAKPISVCLMGISSHNRVVLDTTKFLEGFAAHSSGGPKMTPRCAIPGHRMRVGIDVRPGTENAEPMLLAPQEGFERFGYYAATRFAGFDVDFSETF
jgi:hypothetical protein